MNSKAKQVSVWERIKKQKLLLLMTVPGLVLTFIFKYIPMYGVLIPNMERKLLIGPPTEKKRKIIPTITTTEIKLGAYKIS